MTDEMQDKEIVYAYRTPWEIAPYELISWWDMLAFSAERFLWCGRALRSIVLDCVLGAYVGPEEAIFNFSVELNDAARKTASERLHHVENVFRKLGMPITADTIKEVIDVLESESQIHKNFQWLKDQIGIVEKLAGKEIKNHTFLFIPTERAKFFPRINDYHIFGEPVANAFPSAVYDIFESGMCLALARGTACVFHLMRVLEIGLTVLGNKFGVSMEHTNWAPTIEQIESKIRNMHKDPTWNVLSDHKEQKEFYAQAVSHFGILKDAWRNHTMHVRGIYTEEQAELIFNNVKSFMQKLSTKLSENP